MKKIISFSIILFTTFVAKSQYYYNDIIATNLGNAQQKLLLANNIKKIKVVNKDADGTLIEGFLLEQKINKAGAEIVTTSTNQSGGVSTLTSTYNNNKVIATTDNNFGVQTSTQYEYNDKALLSSVKSSTIDTFMNSSTEELHLWQYNANNMPYKMFKIKNLKDTTVVDLVLDKDGTVAVEVWKKNNKVIESYFYYYNEAGNITQILRNDTYQGKMIPVTQMDYNTEGRVQKMIQVLSAGKSYNIWKYYYNTNGLKSKEECYDKQKQLLGTMEYSYN